MLIDVSLYVFLLSDSPPTDSRHQLSDVANGLNYLHSCSVIHGDLKGVRDFFLSRFTIHNTKPAERSCR